VPLRGDSIRKDPASSQSPRFELLEVNEVRRLHSCLFPDFDEFRRLEKALGVFNGSPSREMNNPVRIVLILENLIRAFARVSPNAGGVIENRLPSGIILDLVDNQNVLHESHDEMTTKNR
jgi:hypothetical protein